MAEVDREWLSLTQLPGRSVPLERDALHVINATKMCSVFTRSRVPARFRPRHRG